jgi:chromosome segregation ATPase
MPKTRGKGKEAVRSKENQEALSMEDAMNEALHDQAVQFPPLSTLLEQATQMEDVIRGASTSLSQVSGKKRRRTDGTPDESGPTYEEMDNADDADDVTSFASFRDLAELREDLSQAKREIEALKDKIGLMEAERSNLPKHLASIRNDMNQQLTLIMDRLNMLAESDVTPAHVQAAAVATAQVRASSTQAISNLATHLSGEITHDTPLTSGIPPKPSNSRFRPVR